MKKSFMILFIMISASFTIGYSQEEACLVEGNPTSTQYINSTINLKILLVQFTDVKCKKISGNNPKYTEANFEEMFGSDGIYVSPVRYTPDGDAVYGSMNDYFRKMSSGNVVINASLLNEIDDVFMKPTWITLGNSKSYYHATPYWYQTLVTDALTAASTEGINVGTLDDYNKLVIIYAGNRYNGGGLNPYANGIGGTIYIMSEREDAPMDQENSTDKFARIGTHCHEFAHTLGIKHASGSRADVMESGARNGNRAAPAPLNPIARMAKGWLTPTTISGQQQYDLYYSLTASQVFRINGNVSGEFILIENRKFDQNMTIGSTSIPDYNNSAFMPIAHSQNSTNVVFSQGVLVWRATYNYPYYNYEDNGLIYASGRYNKSFPENIPTETDAGDLFPGAAGIKVISPWSDYRNPYGTSSGAPNNVFVPNTQSSTNVGMEILSENSGGGYFTVKMYQSSPQDASPSKPQNIAIEVYQNGGDNNPKVTWTTAGEPDVTSGGYVVLERRMRDTRIQNDPWSEWSTIATISGSSGYYIDQTITSAGSGALSLQYRFRFKDSQNKFSEYSDVVNMSASPYFDKRGIAEITPTDYSLKQNFPNPFNPSTTIKYELPVGDDVVIKVYNVLGSEVATLVNGFKPAGYYEASFDASSLSSGIYLYRITAGKYSEIRKMMLIK